MKQTLYSGIVVLFLMLIIGFTGAGNYSVINKSGTNITSFSITPSGDNIGNSVSFNRSISKDQSISIDLNINSEVCQYDIKFSDDQGRNYVMTGIELCGTDEITLVTNKADEVPQIINKNR